MMAMAMMSWLFAIPLLGAMTGLRSMTPMAVLCWFAYRHHLPIHHSWAFWCANPISVGVFTVLAIGEFIGDKLPMTPSRISAFPLVGRVCFGGLVGAICATGLHGAAFEGVILGAIGAVFGAFLGFHFRQWLTKTKGLPDLPIALAEDVFAVGVSIIAMGIVTG